jgi:hypothetical protein
MVVLAGVRSPALSSGGPDDLAHRRFHGRPSAKWMLDRRPVEVISNGRG